MEILLENLFTYTVVLVVISAVLILYFRINKIRSGISEDKLKKAKEQGLHEPVSLHPVVNPEMCIGSGACILACPEKDILGLIKGQAAAINASRCIGHGACFHACPMNAISLHIGTESRGVELPHLSSSFETNVRGIYIAGELGGMGLIKNAIEQGREAVENIAGSIKPPRRGAYDLIIIGAGPAGISASLTAKIKKLKFLTLEQDTLGGTVAHYPRGKIVMTSPAELPGYGKLKLAETTKSELLEIWKAALSRNEISINENERVTGIKHNGSCFEVAAADSVYTADYILIAAGRRGSPRKLNVRGEEKEKVYYRLLEPEYIKNKKVLVAGGGDSAAEAALALTEGKNEVTLSYRGPAFSRIKPANLDRLLSAAGRKELKILLQSNVVEIDDNTVTVKQGDNILSLENDLVYIFAGGEMPMALLENAGVKITKKYGEEVFRK